MNEENYVIDSLEKYNRYKQIYNDLTLEKNSYTLLYHYTSFNILKKILSTQMIRFTKASCFEDKTEGKYINKILQNSIKKCKNINVRNFLHNIKPNKKELFVYYDKLRNVSTSLYGDYETYISCFTKDNNNPYMWKNYIKDEFGANFEITDGFFSCGLTYEDCKRKFNFDIECFQIEYDVYNHYKYIEFLISQLEKYSFNDFDFNCACSAFCNTFNDIKFVYKNPKYKEEKEVRFSVKIPKCIEKEINGYIAVNNREYIDIKLDELPISIKLSSNINQEKAKSELSSIYKGIEVIL